MREIPFCKQNPPAKMKKGANSAKRTAKSSATWFCFFLPQAAFRQEGFELSYIKLYGGYYT